jgi:hypothetical protein
MLKEFLILVKAILGWLLGLAKSEEKRITKKNEKKQKTSNFFAGPEFHQ